MAVRFAASVVRKRTDANRDGHKVSELRSHGQPIAAIPTWAISTERRYFRVTSLSTNSE